MESRQDAAWVASLGVGIALWEIAARLLTSSRLPPFSAVVLTIVEMARAGTLVSPLAASIGSLAVGLMAAAMAGIVFGLLTARSYIFEHLFSIYFDALMSAPTLIYVPVLFALFGISRASQVAVVFAYAFFVIAATTSAGIRGVDRRLIEMARAFGASEKQIFRRVSLPAAAPLVLTGLRLGTTRAVKGMVVGEMIIALSGLGAMLKAYGAEFDMTGVLAVLMVIVIVSVVSNAIVGAIGRSVVTLR